MNWRGLVVLIFILAALLVAPWLMIPARSETIPPVGSYCQQIREVVSSIGEKEAERAARAAGASEQQIAEAKACLRHHK